VREHDGKIFLQLIPRGENSHSLACASTTVTPQLDTATVA
jgi:hypothetical protein